MKDITTLLASIPLTESDNLLLNWGFNLATEYFEILRHASINNKEPILELATGTGRMSAVLTRLGYDVETGDVSLKDRDRCAGKTNVRANESPSFGDLFERAWSFSRCSATFAERTTLRGTRVYPRSVPQTVLSDARSAERMSAEQAEKRIGKEYLHKVKFLSLNMELLPY